MKPLPHRYEVRLTGGPAGYADLRGAGLPVLRTAPPVQYDGPGDAWSPEELLLASVQACFLFTLRAVARVSAIAFTHLEADAAGTVDRRDGATRFVEIVLRARIAVPPGVDAARALLMVERARKACLVSASLSTPLRLVAEIQEARQPVAAAAAS